MPSTFQFGIVLPVSAHRRRYFLRRLILKTTIFSSRPWPRTVASTEAPSTWGLPTWVAASVRDEQDIREHLPSAFLEMEPGDADDSALLYLELLTRDLDNGVQGAPPVSR